MMCDCNRSGQGRATCPTPILCDAMRYGMADDPQIHTSEVIRTKRSLSEAFGTAAFDPYEWAPRPIPWTRWLAAWAVVLVVLALASSFALERP